MSDPGPPGALPGWLSDTLLERRTLFLRGPLAEREATELATLLMALDGTGDQGITLHLSSSGGGLEAAFTVMDTIDTLGVPVTAICSGALEGPAVGVLAVAHHRLVAPHATLQLCDPGASGQGSASDLEGAANRHLELLARFIARVALATRQPAERVEIDLGQGRRFDAAEALTYRLVDGIRG